MKGFTLIEVLVSVALLLLITISSTYLLRTAFNLTDNALDMEKALNRLRLLAEETRALPFDGLVNRDGSVRVNQVGVDLKEVIITIAREGGRQPLSVYTLRAR